MIPWKIGARYAMPGVQHRIVLNAGRKFAPSVSGPSSGYVSHVEIVEQVKLYKLKDQVMSKGLGCR